MVNDNEAEAIAHHEAGHAVAAWHFGLDVRKISMSSYGETERERFGGRLKFLGLEANPNLDQIGRRIEGINFAAGLRAELHCCSPSTETLLGYYCDFRYMIHLCDEEVRPDQFYRFSMECAARLVADREREIRELARLLLDKREVKAGQLTAHVTSGDIMDLLATHGEPACDPAAPDWSDKVGPMVAALGWPD